MATPPPGAFAPRPATGFRLRRQGVLHILSGIDHLLFIVSLLFVIRDWKRLAAVVTSFTLAHSVTLAWGPWACAYLPRIVEPMIALTIIYVAAENALRLAPRAAVGVTFAFGLVHGFGFSSVLRESGPRARAAGAGAGGLQPGRRAGPAPGGGAALPPGDLLQRPGRRYERVRLGLNAGLAVIACVWFVQRLMGSVS
jgi:hypothetical protein